MKSFFFFFKKKKKEETKNEFLAGGWQEAVRPPPKQSSSCPLSEAEARGEEVDVDNALRSQRSLARLAKNGVRQKVPSKSVAKRSESIACRVAGTTAMDQVIVCKKNNNNNKKKFCLPTSSLPATIDWHTPKSQNTCGA